MSYVEPQPILECLLQRFLKFFGHSPHLVSAKLTTIHLDKVCFVTKCRFNQLGFIALLLKFPNIVGCRYWWRFTTNHKNYNLWHIFLSMIFLMNAMSENYRRILS